MSGDLPEVEDSNSLCGLRKQGYVMLVRLVKQSYCLWGWGLPLLSHSRRPRVPGSSSAAKDLGTPSHTLLTFITMERKTFGLGQSGKGRNYRIRTHQEDS